jgi:hypothetical protein
VAASGSRGSVRRTADSGSGILRPTLGGGLRLVSGGGLRSASGGDGLEPALPTMGWSR